MLIKASTHIAFSKFSKKIQYRSLRLQYRSSYHQFSVDKFQCKWTKIFLIKLLPFYLFLPLHYNQKCYLVLNMSSVYISFWGVQCCNLNRYVVSKSIFLFLLLLQSESICHIESQLLSLNQSVDINVTWEDQFFSQFYASHPLSTYPRQ